MPRAFWVEDYIQNILELKKKILRQMLNQKKDKIEK